MAPGQFIPISTRATSKPSLNARLCVTNAKAIGLSLNRVNVLLLTWNREHSLISTGSQGLGRMRCQDLGKIHEDGEIMAKLTSNENFAAVRTMANTFVRKLGEEAMLAFNHRPIRSVNRTDPRCDSDIGQLGSPAIAVVARCYLRTELHSVHSLLTDTPRSSMPRQQKRSRRPRTKHLELAQRFPNCERTSFATAPMWRPHRTCPQSSSTWVPEPLGCYSC